MAARARLGLAPSFLSSPAPGSFSYTISTLPWAPHSPHSCPRALRPPSGLKDRATPLLVPHPFCPAPQQSGRTALTQGSLADVCARGSSDDELGIHADLLQGDTWRGQPRPGPLSPPCLGRSVFEQESGPGALEPLPCGLDQAPLAHSPHLEPRAICAPGWHGSGQCSLWPGPSAPAPAGSGLCVGSPQSSAHLTTPHGSTPSSQSLLHLQLSWCSRLIYFLKQVSLYYQG